MAFLFIMKLSKSELRRIYLDKRKSLSEDEIDRQSVKITENIINYFDWEKIENIHTFLPIKHKKEVNTEYLIKFLWNNDKNVFVPKIIDDNIYTFALTPNTVLEKNTWGILEPQRGSYSEVKKFDLVITPLLYCDNQGNRIGYGKGFYDRFFTQINRDSLKVGVNFFLPNEEIIDVFSGDIPLDYLVTSEEVFSFKSKSIK